ncbi:MAG: hypothetical protein LPK26_10340 [Bacillaceae bacterium]|nr:hypothetical protein [Bacillaceae bacterium]
MNGPKCDEKGSALIFVLFVIAFLSIVTTTMLNSSLYSQKSIVTNSQLQSEFYKAEGAIDLVLYEMEEDPYSFLELFIDGEENNQTLLYTINEKEIEISIHSEETNYEEFDDRIEQEITATLTAKVQDDGHLNREIIVRSNQVTPIIYEDIPGEQDSDDGSVGDNPPEEGHDENDNNNDYQDRVFGEGNVIYYVGGSIDKAGKNHLQADKGSLVGISTTEFNNVRNHLTQKLQVKSANIRTNRENLLEQGRYSSINILGGNRTVVRVPSNQVVYIDELRLTGNSTFIVDGLLVTNDLFINGNFDLVIRSGVIANKFEIGGNPGTSNQPLTIKAEGATGVPCSLITGTVLYERCKQTPPNDEDGSNGSGTTPPNNGGTSPGNGSDSGNDSNTGGSSPEKQKTFGEPSSYYIVDSYNTNR